MNYFLRTAWGLVSGAWADPARHYTSTACQHALHDRCRRTCKFCGAACRCGCHATTDAPPKPV